MRMIQGGHDEWWEYFPCPFCYTEVEVPFLCDHLQVEHCFDMKNAVCPICADCLGSDTAAHFRIQHSHLLKGGSLVLSRAPHTTQAAAENEADEDEEDYIEAPSHCMGRLDEFEEDISTIRDDQWPEQSVMDVASQQDIEERLQRVEFAKQMLMTTIA
ncbi:hypothetical protein ACP70R_024035 [Stipagrostis hirtigluma subsp. patula]